jgi:cell division protein FtsX
MSDFAFLGILLAVSAACVPVALAAASALKLERFAEHAARYAGAAVTRFGAGLLAIAALCVLLGVLPAGRLLEWWAGATACVATFGALALLSVPVVNPSSRSVAQAEPTENKAAA